MNIRSITFFTNLSFPLKEAFFKDAQRFISSARQAFEDVGYPVQTTRLVTQPFPTMVDLASSKNLAAVAVEVEALARQAGFDYVALGPALPDFPDSYPAIPEALAATQNLFLSGLMTIPGKGISLRAIKACANAIHQIAPIYPDGFANLRFAALANTPPGSPFFPGAYHGGEKPVFSLALEAAGLAVDACTSATTLAEAQRSLISSLETHAAALSQVCVSLEKQFAISFGGLDFSLAPFPDQGHSTGFAMECLGIPAVGMPGSLAAAALLADCLDRAQFQKAGFNGLFIPVLEDSTLAKRVSEGVLTLKDLLVYSAVCGTGLDCIPLPGNVSPETLYAVLLDVAALSQRLNKPLTARLMPIPGKAAGEPTGFDFAFFANSRIMAVDSQPIRSLLSGDEVLQIFPKHPKGIFG